MPVQLVRRGFSVAEYQRMLQAGILGEDDRVELLDGEIVKMAPVGSRHAACVKRLNRLLSLRLGGQVVVSVQDPINLAEHSQPQPDLAAVLPRADFYARAHPTAADVLLVVEVAETSAGVDREVKVPLCARAGIAEAWLVDLAEECVEVYRSPAAHGYREVERLRRGQDLSPQGFPDVRLPVDDVLG